ncbi:hypothetical protein EDC04DRAFT_2718040 [Pisolithus marmoratus]|nr:hypothetical protein EDC04DRAFT_2718040 [Pisolithus marmoratus]
MNMESNSVLTHYPEKEHVFSPMRPGTKRSIDGNEGAGDEKNWEEEDEDDKKGPESTGMGDSDAEVETGLHMGVDLALERRSGRLEKNGEIEGGGTHMAQGSHEAKNGKSDRPQKKGRTPKSTSVQTLPAKRTKYIPRPASATAMTISNTTASTSTMTTTKMTGDRTGTRGKTVGAPHLTQLREAHRRLGITKSERVVVSSASGSGSGRTTGRRIGVRPSSRSVSASLLQRRTQPVVGDVEVGTSRAGPSVPTKQREREPWVDVRTVDTNDSRMGGTRSGATAVHLTKPVPFTFRVDARVRRVVTDPCVSGSGLNGGSSGGGIHTGQKDKGKKRDDGLKKLKLLEPDHGESWMRRQKERVPSSSRVFLDGATTKPTTSINTATTATTTTTTTTTVPHPFTFTTTLRATERAKFDALIRRKQEEMARVREQARKRAEEEMEREVREMRRRAVPKAHEVPEWYKEMPKRGGDGMGGG